LVIIYARTLFAQLNQIITFMIFQKLIKKIRKKFQKGFTLVEIMVSITIIGLLAALIFVGAQSALESGRDSRR